MMLIMMKIGLFTFGGGHAMIALLENEFVGKRKWLESEEFVDLVAIAESTPGPIAINCATYLGYKRAGVIGSVLSTIGVCLPSITIIYLITLFIKEFLAIELVAKAFLGMRVAVSLLIISAGLRMIKKEKKSLSVYVLFSLSLIFSLVVALTSIDFPSIFLILIGGAIGICIWLVGKAKKTDKKKEENQ
ncbi:MAG: chromate transporter [Clostridia bacterium]|nr:chromate transporter [Clostridia bacterium]